MIAVERDIFFLFVWDLVGVFLFHVGVEIFLFRWLWLLRKWNQKGVLFAVAKMISRIISSIFKENSVRESRVFISCFQGQN